MTFDPNQARDDRGRWASGSGGPERVVINSGDAGRISAATAAATRAGGSTRPPNLSADQIMDERKLEGEYARTQEELRSAAPRLPLFQMSSDEPLKPADQSPEEYNRAHKKLG